MTIRIPNAATCLLLGLALMLMPSACANDDSHSTDAAMDALHDDAGTDDASTEDASTEDASTEDASTEDAGAEDAGKPTNAIRVELTWTTPGDSNENDEGEGAGSNLDLHLIHSAAPQNASAPDSDGDGAPDPYFDDLYDCHAANPEPDWGAGVSARLDRDDPDGAGPENITMEQVESEAIYRAAVHYVDDWGFGSSFATLRIFLDEQLVYEVSQVELQSGDLWCVAFITAESMLVEPCESPSGATPWIIPDYPLP